MVFRVDVRVGAGDSLRNDAARDQLRSEFPDVAWGFGPTGLVATVMTEDDPVHAVCDVSTRFMHRFADAKMDGIDDDLVGVSDIARRIGVSRELVRLWSVGDRGPGLFPSPIGRIASTSTKSATKIWAWRHVNTWLSTLGLDDGFTYPTDQQVAEVNLFLARGRDLQDGWVDSPAVNGGRVQSIKHRLALHIVREPDPERPLVIPDVATEGTPVIFFNGGRKQGMYTAIPSKRQSIG